MKNFGALIVLIFSFSAVVGQETDIRQVGKFSGVKATEGIDVYLKKGDKEAVRVEVTGTDPSNIITEISGSYLKIHMKDGRYRDVDAKVYVTYVQIDRLAASSAGNIFSDGTIMGKSIEISASSAGTVDVTLDVQSANVSASSAGDVDLKGKAAAIVLEVSSAGEVDAYDLEADVVSAHASSAGSIKVNVKESLEAHAGSGGSVRYRGNPDRSNTNSSSGGSVRKSD